MQPIAEIAAVAHEFGIPVHSDAVQAVGQVAVDFAASGLDLRHVVGSQDRRAGRRRRPAGAPRRRARAADPRRRAGARRALRHPRRRLDPGLRGSGRFRRTPVGRRGAAAHRAARPAGPQGARDRARRRTQRRPGPTTAGRLPGNAHFSFPGCEGDSLLYLLDAAGVECSTGSACQAGVPQPSHVLLAMGMPNDRPAAPCGSRSDTPPPRPTSTRSSRRCPRRCNGPGTPASPRGRRRPWTPHPCRARSADEGPRGDERRGRLRGRRGPRGRRRPRRRRRAPGAVAQPCDPAHGRARLLHDRGRGRRPPGRRRARHPVLRLGPRRPVPRPDVVDDFVAEYAAGRTPNPCLRCNEKIKFSGPAGQGAGAGVRRRCAPATTRSSPMGRCARCTVRSTWPRTSPTSSAVLTPQQLAGAMFPLGDTLKSAVRAEAEARGLAGGRQARQPRHLLHPRRRHPRRSSARGSASAHGRVVDEARRGARPATTAPTRSPSGSAMACGSARPPRTASPATCWASSRSAAGSGSGRPRAWPSTGRGGGYASPAGGAPAGGAGGGGGARGGAAPRPGGCPGARGTTASVRGEPVHAGAGGGRARQGLGLSTTAGVACRADRLGRSGARRVSPSAAATEAGGAWSVAAPPPPHRRRDRCRVDAGHVDARGAGHRP